MKVVNDFPPNIELIAQVFRLSGREIFAYGDTIYNPSGGNVSRSLLAHEMVHSVQQGTDPDAWWDRYLVDPPWRFQQELEAHRAEYRHVVESGAYSRNQRRAILKQIAKRLASPLYGRLASYEKCRHLITEH